MSLDQTSLNDKNSSKSRSGPKTYREARRDLESASEQSRIVSELLMETSSSLKASTQTQSYRRKAEHSDDAIRSLDKGIKKTEEIQKTMIDSREMAKEVSKQAKILARRNR